MRELLVILMAVSVVVGATLGFGATGTAAELWDQEGTTLGFSASVVSPMSPDVHDSGPDITSENGANATAPTNETLGPDNETLSVPIGPANVTEPGLSNGTDDEPGNATPATNGSDDAGPPMGPPIAGEGDDPVSPPPVAHPEPPAAPTAPINVSTDTTPGEDTEADTAGDEPPAGEGSPHSTGESDPSDGEPDPSDGESETPAAMPPAPATTEDDSGGAMNVDGDDGSEDADLVLDDGSEGAGVGKETPAATPEPGAPPETDESSEVTPAPEPDPAGDRIATPADQTATTES